MKTTSNWTATGCLLLDKDAPTGLIILSRELRRQAILSAGQQRWFLRIFNGTGPITEKRPSETDRASSSNAGLSTKLQVRPQRDHVV